MTIKYNQNFYCEYCEHSWSRKYDIDQHMKTKKHMKNETKSIETAKKGIENEKISIEQREMAAKTDNYNNEIVLENVITREKKIKTHYSCDYCHFSTTIKKESEKHRKSKQHIRNEIKEEDFLEISQKFVCLSCDKSYDKYVSCWKHSKSCKGKNSKPNTIEMGSQPLDTLDALDDCNSSNSVTRFRVDDIEAIKKEVYENIVIKMLENNTNVMEKIAENNANMMEKVTENNINVMEKVIEKVSESTGQMLDIANTMKNSVELVTQHNAVSNIHNNIIQNNIQNNTDNRVTNNHCTVNVFLNEKCKDAMNIFDFISNMNITFDHLYHQADNGFQKGVTKILLDNLKLLSIYNRPIHFTDLKREIMYIKDNDEWTKHEDKEKLIEALEWAAKQGVNCFVDWREATSAENEDLDSPTGQMWMKLMQTVVHPHDDRMKAYPKIMKEIARNTHLKKEDQT